MIKSIDDYKIVLHNSAIIVNDYTWGDCITLENYFANWDPVRHSRDYVGIYYDKSTRRSVKRLVYPVIEGVKWIDFLGKRVLVPVNAEKHLEAIYGKTWKIPDPGYKPDRKQDIMPGLGDKIKG